MLSIIYAEADRDHHSLLLFPKVAENKPQGGMKLSTTALSMLRQKRLTVVRGMKHQSHLSTEINLVVSCPWFLMDGFQFSNAVSEIMMKTFFNECGRHCANMIDAVAIKQQRLKSM